MGFRAGRARGLPGGCGRGLRDPFPPGPQTGPMTRQNLIVDADDTLWENNIYFENAFEDFFEFLAHSHLSPQEVRDVLDEIEVANARVHGYGSLNFGRNLSQCYTRLSERDVCE